MKLPTRFLAKLFLILLLTGPFATVNAQDRDTTLVLGAERTQRIQMLLHGMRVGVIANHTSMVGNVHLVDTLLALGVEVRKVFAPEHGFRGEAGPGDVVGSGIDSKTGLPVVSLYGNHKKPTQTDLADIDVLVFDIQDVGARFYTYISTLQYAMQACAEYRKKMVVLDRPNPHGSYIDGPVLDTAFRSFVGMAPIPIVHGLTVGEYAKMVNGEKWNGKKNKCRLRVVRMINYDHSMRYVLPIKPSPNLPNQYAIDLYPSLCLFEGTRVSVGRGTTLPFQMIGFPGMEPHDTSFCPLEIPGVIKDPPYEEVECNGRDLRAVADSVRAMEVVNIKWLLELYASYPRQDMFFIPFFDKLAGTDKLRIHIRNGWTEEQIRGYWESPLASYRKLRKKYLLYPEIPE
jgi:uncharacterized protein YbbC (DUF1343 family)